MSAKQLTAEQKLQKMIEASKGGGGKSASGKVPSKKQDLLTVLKTINQVLLLGVVLGGLWLGYEVMQGMKLMNEPIDTGETDRVVRKTAGGETFLPVVQRLSYYLAGVKKRNIFTPYAEPEIKNIVESSDENILISKKTDHLKLVGISWLDTIESASVMIEDTEKNVTYFLRKNENVGDIVVKTIYADSVALGYKDEEIIIRYDK